MGKEIPSQGPQTEEDQSLQKKTVSIREEAEDHSRTQESTIYEREKVRSCSMKCKVGGDPMHQLVQGVIWRSSNTHSIPRPSARPARSSVEGSRSNSFLILVTICQTNWILILYSISLCSPVNRQTL